MEWNVVYYMKENGEEPALDFIASLPAKHRAKALWEVRLLAEHGISLREPYTKSIRPRRENSKLLCVI